jgi:delta 1-pyrroline-5-carboxylate dehydrogenase
MIGNNMYNVPQEHLDGAAAVRKSIDSARRRLERITVSDGHKELADAAAAHAAIAQAEATLLLAGQQGEANDLARIIEMVRISVWATQYRDSLKLLLGDATIANPVPEGEFTLERWISGLRPGVRELFERTLFPEAGASVPSDFQEMPSPWDVGPK